MLILTINPYQGINPHLNSVLQTPSTEEAPSFWGTFHAAHLHHIADALNAQLPNQYIAYSEHSLSFQPAQRPVAGVIREIGSPNMPRGKVVTRIELLVPLK